MSRLSQPKELTGHRIRVVARFLSSAPHGATGIIVSGPSENRLFRVRLEGPDPVEEGKSAITFLFREEFELIEEGDKKV